MIKAVFFDLYHTLIRYEPPRELLEVKALNELGIEVSAETVRPALVAADEFIYGELARIPFSERSDEDRKQLYLCYQQTIFREIGIPASDKLALAMLGKWQGFKSKLVLFDDVLPSLRRLKERNLTLGLISNVDRDITQLLDEVGLSPLLDIVVTSLKSGFNKPQPEIFQAALSQCSIAAAETIYVGDQYRIDVLGAEQAGLKGVLLDRYNSYKTITDQLRISSLSEIEKLLSV